MDLLTRFKVIKYVAWAISTFAFIVGLVFTTDPQISPVSQIFANIMIQAGGAFFFALTVGWIIDRVRDQEGYSILWLFSQEFRKAGVLAFYSDRKGLAEEVLEEAFEKHSGGEILIAGASLRLFLAPGLHFRSYIEQIIRVRRRNPIVVKALTCSPDKNNELPVRSFVEEFNQDKTMPKSLPFDWNEKIKYSFTDFKDDFFKTYGLDAPHEQRVRVIQDLHSTRVGVKELKGIAGTTGNFILHREFDSAPYCTVVIFPDRAFYTPNLLCTEVPVNMPMIVFHKTSDVYKKLVNYVEFLWWVSDQQEDVENE